MSSRNSNKFPRYEREVHYYRAPEFDKWPSADYDYYLIPVAKSVPEYIKISPSPQIDDPRLRLSIVSTSPSADDPMHETPSTSNAGATPKSSEQWYCRDPRIMKNPNILTYTTKMPKLCEAGPYPTSFHFYYSSHEPQPSTNSNPDHMHAPQSSMNQTQCDAPPPMQKWSKVTNLNQIPPTSPTDAYRVRKLSKHRHLNQMPRPPTPRPTASEQLLWNDLNQIPLPPDPNEIF